MSTALIGKHCIELGCKARVGFVKHPGDVGLAATFARTDHELIECADWQSLAAAAATAPFDLVLLDEQAATLPRGEIACPVLVVADRPVAGHVSVSVHALDGGLEAIVAVAVALTQSHARNRELEQLLDGIRSGSAIVGHSPPMRRLVTAISRAADGDATVLVEGPPGSGKSLVARAIHCKSRRCNRALVALDGATTSADALAKGLDEARGTTLVVEDVDRLVPAAQSVLVRHLKERPSGGPSAAPRVVTTSSAHLPELVARGAFREDLFYRLHTCPIVVPALRERTEDVALLARSIVETSATTNQRATALTPAAISYLERSSWPGNVTQLEAVIRRAQLAAGGGTIDAEHFAVTTSAPTAAAAAASPAAAGDDDDVTEAAVLPFEQEEQRMLTRALRATKGNVRRAAQLLGIGRATLYRKIQQYHLRLQ